MRSKNVTLADIAKELGISKNAVSLALRNKEGVSRELRERVMAKANEMHYQAVSKMQGCILALIPQRYTGAGSIFYHRLCFEMEAYAANLGYQLIISSVSESAEAQCQEPYMLSAAQSGHHQHRQSFPRLLPHAPEPASALRNGRPVL